MHPIEKMGALVDPEIHLSPRQKFKLLLNQRNGIGKCRLELRYSERLSISLYHMGGGTSGA